MIIDMGKLTPAPWRVCLETEDWGTLGMPVARMTAADSGDDTDIVVGHPADWGATFPETDAEFIALARNAFDVMVRRGWHARRATTGEWVVHDGIGLANSQFVFGPNQSLIHGDNPFTALVKADQWYRENVEGERFGEIRRLSDD